MKHKVTPRNHELVMKNDDLILSKTDPSGKITYANNTFKRFAGYCEAELLNIQHSIVRHPDMPRGLFKLLWDSLHEKQEVYAYVKNMAKDGSFYWTFANIAPDFDLEGNIVGYYSVRRKPEQSSIDKIQALYQEMLEAEQKVERRESVQASLEVLLNYLSSRNVKYEEFIHEV